MLFDSNRLQRLSGLVDGHTYRKIALNEQLEVGVEEEEVLVDDGSPIEDVGEVIPVEDAETALVDLGNALGLDVTVGEEEEEVLDSETDVDVEDLAVEEARLRGAIRKEVRAVIEEVMEDRDQKQVERGLQNHSISQALGYASGGTRRTARKNRALSPGPGFSHGFGGPGFM